MVNDPPPGPPDDHISARPPGASPPEAEPPPRAPLAPTPFSWRVAIGLSIVVLGLAAFLLRDLIGPRGQAGVGFFCFIGLVAMFSANLRAVNWRTIGWGVALQVGLALFILKFEIAGYRPGYALFKWLADLITAFVAFADAGARFVFGPLADPETMARTFGGNSFVFAVSALPPIIFVSSFFAVLYYLGVLQLIVRAFARAMMYLMGTSGAETLSATANVFMGQTEAPLIVKPYVPRMTDSELLALMVGGMATISGGIMAVYIKMGADPVAILATSVMAAPCGLYLAKLLLPETGVPETGGQAQTGVEQPYRNVVDAAAAGASDGMMLAINVAAMLIAFLAFIALINALLGLLQQGLSLEWIFARAFAPAAFLMGVEPREVFNVADLLGTKLAANEFVAYAKLTGRYPDNALAASVVGMAATDPFGALVAAGSAPPGAGLVRGSRSYVLATYALTGFANFGSIGIQLGGIGALAPGRRGDLARLGMRALFAGFLATLTNAALAGLLLE
ncbi:MAG: Na+ dependent nucleoside transporter domain protein [Gemmataceae bacterium]|nr:Na+ dependent nucleoside transporter domain protein [Gemmataceae bacterium]